MSRVLTLPVFKALLGLPESQDVLLLNVVNDGERLQNYSPIDKFDDRIKDLVQVSLSGHFSIELIAQRNIVEELFRRMGSRLPMQEQSDNRLFGVLALEGDQSYILSTRKTDGSLYISTHSMSNQSFCCRINLHLCLSLADRLSEFELLLLLYFKSSIYSIGIDDIAASSVLDHGYILKLQAPEDTNLHTAAIYNIIAEATSSFQPLIILMEGQKNRDQTIPVDPGSFFSPPQNNSVMFLVFPSKRLRDLALDGLILQFGFGSLEDLTIRLEYWNEKSVEITGISHSDECIGSVHLHLSNCANCQEDNHKVVVRPKIDRLYFVDTTSSVPITPCRLSPKTLDAGLVSNPKSQDVCPENQHTPDFSVDQQPTSDLPVGHTPDPLQTSSDDTDCYESCKEGLSGRVSGLKNLKLLREMICYFPISRKFFEFCNELEQSDEKVQVRLTFWSQIWSLTFFSLQLFCIFRHF